MYAYYDRQIAKVGDIIQGGNAGTCRVESIRPRAIIRNIQTGETWEFDGLSAFDLLTRASTGQDCAAAEGLGIATMFDN